jgi:DNA-binding transcriptional MerR regulator
VGLHSRTLQRYRAEGLITPELESKGGHARWDVEKVIAQLREMAQRERERRAEE